MSGVVPKDPGELCFSFWQSAPLVCNCVLVLFHSCVYTCCQKKLSKLIPELIAVDLFADLTLSLMSPK